VLLRCFLDDDGLTDTTMVAIVRCASRQILLNNQMLSWYSEIFRQKVGSRVTAPIVLNRAFASRRRGGAGNWIGSSPSVSLYARKPLSWSYQNYGSFALSMR
jgi:hypothetical protein